MLAGKAQMVYEDLRVEAASQIVHMVSSSLMDSKDKLWWIFASGGQDALSETVHRLRCRTAAATEERGIVE